MAAKPMLRNRLACRIMASAWSTIGRGSFERGAFHRVGCAIHRKKGGRSARRSEPLRKIGRPPGEEV